MNLKELELYARKEALKNLSKDEVKEAYLDIYRKLKDVDEPSKPAIPQFVADWIENAKEYYGDEISPLKMVYWIGEYIDDVNPHYEWLGNIYNQKLLLNVIVNGYKVEAESKYHVRVKGFNTVANYLNYDTNDKYFYTDVPDFVSFSKSRFTKSWLAKNWSEYEAYNNAGLLEFEEVEN